jgi:ribose transport system ATP-binding protein
VAPVSLTNLAKAFGATRALDDVSLEIEAGEVHGLLGENGAGKSTLVKILSGVVVPDAGEVAIDGDVLPFGNPQASRAIGISTAFQELSMLPNLTVAQNLLLPDLPRGPSRLLSGQRTRARARAILAEWSLEGINPSATIDQLPLAQRQRLEIIRAFSRGPKLLVLDEPTAALPETEWLFQHIEAITAAGVSVLYISHRLAEIRRICGRGTVLRNGRVVGSFEGTGFDEKQVISVMIGRSLDLTFPPRRHADDADATTVLAVRELEVGDRVRGVSLELRRGEIAGVAGLEGQGQRELFYALFGLEPPSGGEIEVEGRTRQIRHPRQALAAGPGIVLVPEERKSEGLFLDLTAQKNLTLPALRSFSFGGLLSPGAENRVARRQAERLNIDRSYLDRLVSQLSGGNQQKVLLGRTLLTGAGCLLLFDPTRGIDAGTKLEIYDLIRQFAAEGGCVLLYSTEIPELVGLCDRIYVMYGGLMVEELAGGDLSEESVLAAAVGHVDEVEEVVV